MGTGRLEVGLLLHFLLGRFVSICSRLRRNQEVTSTRMNDLAVMTILFETSSNGREYPSYSKELLDVGSTLFESRLLSCGTIPA
jgi:hypothetical protein